MILSDAEVAALTRRQRSDAQKRQLRHMPALKAPGDFSKKSEPKWLTPLERNGRTKTLDTLRVTCDYLSMRCMSRRTQEQQMSVQGIQVQKPRETVRILVGDVNPYRRAVQSGEIAQYCAQVGKVSANAELLHVEPNGAWFRDGAKVVCVAF